MLAQGSAFSGCWTSDSGSAAQPRRLSLITAGPARAGLGARSEPHVRGGLDMYRLCGSVFPCLLLAQLQHCSSFLNSPTSASCPEACIKRCMHNDSRSPAPAPFLSCCMGGWPATCYISCNCVGRAVTSRAAFAKPRRANAIEQKVGTHAPAHGERGSTTAYNRSLVTGLGDESQLLCNELSCRGARTGGGARRRPAPPPRRPLLHARPPGH